MKLNFDGDDQQGDELGQVVRDFDIKVKNLERQGFGPVTSRLRSRAANLRALGAARSQHLIGTAADFAISPGQVPAFVEAARREGLRIVNEMNRPGHGAHMHVQLYPAGRAPARFFRPFAND